MRTLPLENTERIKSFVRDVEGEAFALLKDMVLINSYTHNKRGVDELVDYLNNFLTEKGLKTEVVHQEKVGNFLVTRYGKEDASLKVFIVGHTDTVFPPGSWEEFVEENGLVKGPGVIDMKGGLVVAIYSVLAMKAMGVDNVFLELFFNSDEEIGSPYSRDFIVRRARDFDMALVFECGGLENTVVTGRRGRMGLRVEIKGEAGHAGMLKKEKKSAVLEMAHKIIKFEELNNISETVSANVGKVSGGVAPNVVPERADMEIDVRYMEDGEREVLLEKIRDIVGHSEVENVHSKFEIVSERPPMSREKNIGLFRRLKAVSDLLDIPVKEEVRFGVSDANWISFAGVPVLDGLGPVGDGDHSQREFVLKRTLPERILMVSAFLLMEENMRKGGDG